MELTFIDELLKEVEEKEETLEMEQADIILMGISDLERLLGNNQSIAEREIKIIKEWMEQKNSKLQRRIAWLSSKLEEFIDYRGLKTIDLPHGTILKRKNPDKVEISDMSLFMSNASNELVTIQPESVKPNLNKVKKYFKLSQKLPLGTRLIEGDIKFSIKLKQKEECNGTTTEVRTEVEPINKYNTAV